MPYDVVFLVNSNFYVCVSDWVIDCQWLTVVLIAFYYFNHWWLLWQWPKSVEKLEQCHVAVDQVNWCGLLSPPVGWCRPHPPSPFILFNNQSRADTNFTIPQRVNSRYTCLPAVSIISSNIGSNGGWLWSWPCNQLPVHSGNYSGFLYHIRLPTSFAYSCISSVLVKHRHV